MSNIMELIDDLVDWAVAKGDHPTTVEARAAVVKAGGKRVTAKAMPGAEFKKACKKAADSMYTALTKVKADPGFAGLSEEVRGILAELLAGIKTP